MTGSRFLIFFHLQSVLPPLVRPRLFPSSDVPALLIWSWFGVQARSKTIRRPTYFICVVKNQKCLNSIYWQTESAIWTPSTDSMIEAFYLPRPRTFLILSISRGGSRIFQLGGGETVVTLVHLWWTHTLEVRPWLGREFWSMLPQKIIGFVNVGGIKKHFKLDGFAAAKEMPIRFCLGILPVAKAACAKRCLESGRGSAAEQYAWQTAARPHAQMECRLDLWTTQAISD